MGIRARKCATRSLDFENPRALLGMGETLRSSQGDRQIDVILRAAKNLVCDANSGHQLLVWCLVT